MINILAMGGYGAYVWPAYSLVFLVLIANGLVIKRERIKTKKKLKQWFESNYASK